MSELTTSLKNAALEAGFSRAHVCSAQAPVELQRFHDWLEAGYDGQMQYLADRQQAYADPNLVLDGVKSILMLTMNYANQNSYWQTQQSSQRSSRTSSPNSSPPAASRADEVASGWGRVARYAWGDSDYHDVIHQQLKQLKRTLLTWRPQAKVRGVVDTAPLLERDLARLAGIGWIGKNTMLINQQDGSWFFLAALLTDLELTPDAAHLTDHCGTCRACLDACPTDAFPEPYVLDSRRCISYLTIELRQSIPSDLRSGMGSWVFGCDICQEVCPWNGKHAHSQDDRFLPQADLHPLQLRQLFELSEDDFRRRFRRTPMWRSKRQGLLRNAAIALGNQANPASLPCLRLGLADESEVVRSASAWALGRIAHPDAQTTLLARQEVETSTEVAQEIAAALAHFGSSKNDSR